MKHKYKWIMFDLGNVLVEYKQIAYKLISEKLNVEPELVKDLLISDELWVKSGKGIISPDDYLKMINDAFGGSLTMDFLYECYKLEVETIIDGIIEILVELQKYFRLAILSNTFFAHWKHIETSEIFKYFDLPMASHLLGDVKPDESIYIKALTRMNAHPDEVIFIDDMEENVKAAKDLGIIAFVSKSIEDTRNGLINAGIKL